MSDAAAELEEPSTRETILAIAPKVSGGLSFVSSAWIAYNVLSDPRRRTKTYQRLLAVLSLCDMVSSFSFFLSTWPVPPGANLTWEKTARLWAHGTAAACTAQAVGIQWGLTSAVLNVALAAHYLLVVRYRFRERALKKYEPWVWGLTLLVGLAATVPGIVLGIYGDTNLWCWITPDFARCAAEGVSEQACLDRAFGYRWAFYYGPLWACIALVTALQAALFATVWKVEARGARWRSTTERQYSHSAQVAAQACWYVGAFYVAWLPYTSLTLTGRWFTSDDGFGVLLLVVVVTPLQGFLNLFVYQRKLVFKTVGAQLQRSSALLRRSASRLRAFLLTPGNGPLLAPEGHREDAEDNSPTEAQDRLLEDIYAD